MALKVVASSTGFNTILVVIHCIYRYWCWIADLKWIISLLLWVSLWMNSIRSCARFFVWHLNKNLATQTFYTGHLSRSDFSMPIRGRIFPTMSFASSHSDKMHLWKRPMQATGSSAPLIHLLILALYISFACVYHMLAHLSFFPYLSFPWE